MDLSSPTSRPSSREAQALALYAQDPMRDGDALVLLDDEVCLELAGLADCWEDAGRRELLDLVATTSRRVVVAIARRRGELRPGDFQIWRDLHAALRDRDVELLPVRALPAA